MRKSIAIISVFILSGATGALSQSPSEEFNSFRNRILSDYSNFKSRILEHYGDFLNGEWHEFEPLWEEESPYTEPKPKGVPEIPAEPEPSPASTKLPDPKFSVSSPGGVLAAVPGGGLAKSSLSDSGMSSMKIDVPSQLGGGQMPETMAASPNASALLMSELKGKSDYELAVMRLPDPGFAFGSFPGQIAAPEPGESGIVNIDLPEREIEPENHDYFLFDYYGMEAFLPEIDFSISKTLSGPEQAGEHWQKMAAQEGGMETARQLFGLARQLGLNGYLTFRLAESYVNQKYKDSDANARMSAVHFLLSNMGYDARLIKLDNIFTVMMPFDQKVVYATMSQTIDGRKYTILYPEGYQPPRGQALKIMTCSLPASALGKTSDLRLTGLDLPMKSKTFNITNGQLSLKGEVNENFGKLLHHYPQMPTGDFASSWVDQKLREDIVEQVKTQLGGLSEKEAVNRLMSLCHKGFNYSTDQDYHGFEKPYFFEENFIYDKNDCEDRAIFFSYLLWNALNLPCQLVQYPGHESATVAVNDDIEGYFYNTDDTKYYSADPTYIGSTVGMVMKAFRTASPTVDKQYK
ncbi:MAG: hypothetical protein K2G85_03230 [Muribaculaceae bacterium]|nr:hypothetical protein [Muribaculaceae bacterium]